ncbi:MAG: histidine phosphatase family protein [Rhodocyclaceae bacterium]
MDLILWRHAEAEDGAPDNGRRLTHRGKKQAHAMAKWLAKRLPAHVRILASPAVRCQQTAAALDMPFETSAKLGTAGSVRDLLLTTGWPVGDGTVLVVGHQPTLGETAALLLCGAQAEWTVKKGAIWWLAGSAADNGAFLRAVVGPDLV